MSALLKVNNLVAIIALIGAIAGPAIGYGILTGSVSANAESISDNADDIDEIRRGDGNVRERLKAIETTQEHQNRTLERILRAVEDR